MSVRTYVLACTTLIYWAHVSPGMGHSGMQQTYSLIQAKYFWPNMLTDIKKFITFCSTCTTSNDPSTLPAGKLMPLPTPSHVSSHISLGFFTDLPESQGMANILIVVNQFSKAFIPLPELPTTFCMAELLFKNVFQYYRILVRILPVTEDLISHHKYGQYYGVSVECQ